MQRLRQNKLAIRNLLHLPSSQAREGPGSSSHKYTSHSRTIANSEWYCEDLVNETEHKIRLLHLQPGKPDDPLSATLVHVAVEHKPRYDALSYSWGDLDQQAWNEIKIDERPGFAVTQTLWFALRRLRSTAAVRALWIDAICINQGNDRERNLQVFHMGTTFSNARSVLVWLGEHEPDMTKPQLTAGIEDIDKFLSRLREVNEHQIRAWWNRVWVVQEVALATEVLVCFGPHTFSWAEFCSMTHNRDEWKAIANLSSIRGSIRSQARQGELVSLTHLLSLTGDFYASDPRDYVFGIMGLATVLRDWKDVPFLVVTADVEGNSLVTAYFRKHTLSRSEHDENRIDLGPGYSLTVQELLKRLGASMPEFGRTRVALKHEDENQPVLTDPKADEDPADNTAYRRLLTWAAGHGHTRIVELLLEPSFISPQLSPDEPLFAASYHGQMAMIRFLMDVHKANPRAKDATGKNALIFAAMTGRNDVIKLFLENPSMDPDEQDSRGRSALSWAVYLGQGETVRLLLNSHRIRYARILVGGDTLLGWAVKQGHWHIVNLLLDKDIVDPNVTGVSGYTPLWWAENNQPSLVSDQLRERTHVPSPPFSREAIMLEYFRGQDFWIDAL